MVYWIQSVLAWQCKWLIRYLLLIISVFHFVLLILHLHCLSFLLGKSFFCLFCFFFYREGRRKKTDINADGEITKVWLYIWSDKKVKVVIAYEFGKTENEPF